MKDLILQYLKDDPRFRQRANKNRGLANLIMKKYGIEIPKEKRDDIITDILNGDRQWRMILKAEPTLRGSDYDDKIIIEQEYELNLGYEPNFTENQKKLNNL